MLVQKLCLPFPSTSVDNPYLLIIWIDQTLLAFSYVSCHHGTGDRIRSNKFPWRDLICLFGIMIFYSLDHNTVVD